MSAFPSPSGVIWWMVPSANPAQSCLPFELQLIQLTWFLSALLIFLSWRFAMWRLPLVVTMAQSSGMVGFGTKDLRASPLVESSNAEFEDPWRRLWTW